MLRGKFLPLNVYIRKGEKSKINNIIFHLRKLEKEVNIKSKVIRRKIIKILEQKSIKLNTGKQKRKSTKPEDGSLKRSIKLINLSLGYEEKKERSRVTKNEREDIITDLKDVKRIIKEY